MYSGLVRFDDKEYNISDRIIHRGTVYPRVDAENPACIFHRSCVLSSLALPSYNNGALGMNVMDPERSEIGESRIIIM